VALAAELTRQVADELAPIRRQLDDLNLCNDSLLREVVRLQRELQELSDSFERLSPIASDKDSPPLAVDLGANRDRFRVAA
jgi:hypothetical protein